MNIRPRLLVMASTYPRWADDPEPGFVHELSRRLTDRFDVTVLAPHAAGAVSEEILDGVRVYRYRYAPARWELLVNDGGIIGNLRRSPWKWLLVPSFMLCQLWSAWWLLRRWRPDVVHAHWLIPQGLLAMIARLFSFNHPAIVVTSHGVDMFALRGPIWNAVKRFVMGRAAAVTVVSSEMKNLAVGFGADPDRIFVQPMGVDMSSRFTPDPAVPRAAAEILFVGRLVEKKGLRHLLAAMPAIIATCPDVYLTVAGFGPDGPVLRDQINQLGLQARVNFIGAVSQPDLPALYRRATLLVTPFVRAASGDQEGLGLVVVEALACGCPVLVGDVPAIRDLPVRSVVVSDHPQLAKAVICMLTDKESSQAQADEQRRICLDQFDWQKISIKYATLLESCFPNQRPSNRTVG